jgi:hypothetical protein
MLGTSNTNITTRHHTVPTWPRVGLVLAARRCQPTTATDPLWTLGPRTTRASASAHDRLIRSHQTSTSSASHLPAAPGRNTHRAACFSVPAHRSLDKQARLPPTNRALSSALHHGSLRPSPTSPRPRGPFIALWPCAQLRARASSPDRNQQLLSLVAVLDRSQGEPAVPASPRSQPAPTTQQPERRTAQQPQPDAPAQAN